MSLPEPIIDTRDYAELLNSLYQKIPAYVPNWMPQDGSSAKAVMRIFARYMEIYADGLNQLPGRSLMTFLDMLGMHLLPAQAARAPLVFTLMDNASSDVTLPVGCRVAAVAAQRVGGGSASPAEALFSTSQTLTLARAKLTTLYSIHPADDEYANHSASLTGGFTLFQGMDLTEHSIYLGHDELFNLTGDNIVVELTLSLVRPASRGLMTQWEYLSDNGWSPLDSTPEDDSTNGLRQDGVITLRRVKGPPAKQETIAGHKSYWLRGRLASPLRQDGIDGERSVPLVNDIRVKVGFSRMGISPEAASMDQGPLDTSKNFYPFGQQPGPHPTFYLGCKEVFSRKGAAVLLAMTLSSKGLVKPSGTGSAPFKLQWEYSTGAGWGPITVQSSAGSEFNFDSEPGDPITLSFNCPRDWAEGKVNDKKNFWLRARVVQGNFGVPPTTNLSVVAEKTILDVSHDRKTLTVESNSGYMGGEYGLLIKDASRVETIISGRKGTDKLLLAEAIPGQVNFKDGVVIAPGLVPGTIQPPVVAKISIAFTYMANSMLLDHCLANNDFHFEDHTADSRWQDRSFAPFVPVDDLQPAVHFGFDRALPEGLVSLFLAVPDEYSPDQPASQVKGSPFTWEYRSAQGWADLGVLDETGGFRQSGMIQFIGQPDAVAVQGLGGELYQVRARLKPGESFTSLPVAGVWFNAAWAEERVAPAAEELGLSDGNPGQTFNLQRAPVIAETKLEVQEWHGRGEGWRTVLGGVPEGDLRFERDPASSQITAAWVTWHERGHLYDSHPGDRHYTLERATGLLRLGGMPPSGSHIVLTYSSGGGIYGNVPAGAIKELRMVVPFIQSVSNPLPASGGRGSGKRWDDQATRPAAFAPSRPGCLSAGLRVVGAPGLAGCRQGALPAGHRSGWVGPTRLDHLDRCARQSGCPASALSRFWAPRARIPGCARTGQRLWQSARGRAEVHPDQCLGGGYAAHSG